MNRTAPGSMHNHDDRANRRFLQPLAVAMVFLLFGLLFFTTAQMDLRRLERLLFDALHKKALYVAEVVEKTSQEKYRLLMRRGEEARGPYTGLSIDEDGFYLQEALARALIDVARFIDSQSMTTIDPQDKLRQLAAEEHFRAIAVFAAKGRQVYPTDPLPVDLADQARALMEGRDEVVVHLFHGLSGQAFLGYVGIRQYSGDGAIFLVLDATDLEHWAWRVAFESSIEELQWGGGLVYVAVEDAAGHLLARSGGLPEEQLEECLLAANTVRESNSPVGQCVRVGEMKFIETSHPFQFEGGAVGTIRIGIETQETDRLLMENRRHIFLWTGLMVMVGLLAMGLLYQTQNRHVAKLQSMQERLHQAERLSSLGKLGAGVAHEIRNPLNSISMAAQRIQRDFAPLEPAQKAAFDRSTYIIRDEIKRLNGIIEDFLGLSRGNRMEFRRQSLVDLLERIVFLAQEEAQPKGIRIEKQWSGSVPLVSMDHRKMEQAILNIVKNAVESIDGEGRVTISCAKAARHRVSIKISDTGKGIPAAGAKLMFDPFYTTKENGVGLGLAIAHEIIRAHGGEIGVNSEEGKGTTVEVLLPAAGSDRNKKGTL